MERPNNLGDVLKELEKAGRERDTVTVADVHRRIGERAFGPLLLVPAIIALTPLGGIPALPTVLATIVFLVAVQIVFGAEGIWLPKAIRDRSLSGDRLEKSASAAAPVARVVDKGLRPRWTSLVRGPTMRFAIAVVCVLLALTVPPLELVPFGGTPTWIAIAAFGLALLADDGLFAAVAFAASAATLYLLFTSFAGG